MYNILVATQLLFKVFFLQIYNHPNEELLLYRVCWTAISTDRYDRL